MNELMTYLHISYLQVEDKVKLTYSAPEELEEAQLIEAADESDIEGSSSSIILSIFNLFLNSFTVKVLNFTFKGNFLMQRDKSDDIAA